MTSLIQQLEQLKKQQLELEKRIQEDEIRKKKLNMEASIDRLEELIKPFTKYLDEERYIKDEFAEKANPIMNTTIRKYLKENNFSVKYIEFNKVKKYSFLNKYQEIHHFELADHLLKERLEKSLTIEARFISTDS